MQARVLTLRFDPLLDRFDDTPLADLGKEHELIEVREHCVARQGQPYLAVVVTYQPAPLPPTAPPPPGQPARATGQDWRELLDPSQLPLFNHLRDWRSARAKRDGVPPYVVCTNRELAQVVVKRPQSAAKLAEVGGFGRAKVERYGGELLALLREAGEPERPAPPPARPEGAV